MVRPALVISAASLALTVLIHPARARASDYDQLTYFTFSAPVQVPGATLGAGTYRFELTNPEVGRNVLRVSNQHGTHVYAQFFLIPERRLLDTPSEPGLTFRETPAGVAPAIRGWTYPGDSILYTFVYSHRQLKAAMSGNQRLFQAD